MLIDRELVRIPYLARNSESVQRLVLESHISNSVHLVKLDVKEFYLSGTAEQLAETAASGFELRSVRVFMKELLLFLLEISTSLVNSAIAHSASTEAQGWARIMEAASRTGYTI